MRKRRARRWARGAELQRTHATKDTCGRERRRRPSGSLWSDGMLYMTTGVWTRVPRSPTVTPASAPAARLHGSVLGNPFVGEGGHSRDHTLGHQGARRSGRASGTGEVWQNETGPNARRDHILNRARTLLADPELGRTFGSMQSDSSAGGFEQPPVSGSVDAVSGMAFLHRRPLSSGR